METEDTNPEAEGQSTSKPSRTYYFDAPELTAIIPWGEGIEMHLDYKKPEDQDHIDYEQAVERVVSIQDGSASDETEAEPANVEFYGRVALRAQKVRKGVKDPLKSYEQADVKRFAAEVQTKFVAAMGQSTFDVIIDDADEDAGLFEPSTENKQVKVRQVFEDKQFEDIIYTLDPMDKSERRDFQSAWKPKEKAERKKVIRRVEAGGVKKGMKYFIRKIKNIEGGLIQRGAYSAETRDDYITQVDKSFQMLVIDAMVAAAGKPPK